MARLIWGDPVNKTYQTGVDRGVLYIKGVGYAWNGLTKVTEGSEAGESRDHYIDGHKYLNLVSLEDFEAKVEAISAPIEFLECDGYGLVTNGLIATQQRHSHFDFSYRTLMGNAAVGDQFGYRIHLVYNALAIRDGLENVSIGENASPSMNSWTFTTRPERIQGLRPTAHFVIDSTLTPKGLMDNISQILYGDESTDSRFPSSDELYLMFSMWV